MVCKASVHWEYQWHIVQTRDLYVHQGLEIILIFVFSCWVSLISFVSQYGNALCSNIYIISYIIGDTTIEVKGTIFRQTDKKLHMLTKNNRKHL